MRLELTEDPITRDPEFALETFDLPKLDHPLDPTVRETRLLTDVPWVRSLGRLDLSVTTEGWKFPAPPAEYSPPAKPHAAAQPAGRHAVKLPAPALPDSADAKPRIRPKPTADTVLFKDRLLYLLQPPLEACSTGGNLRCRSSRSRISSKASRS